jgi:multidrug resistance efflux pump
MGSFFSTIEELESSSIVMLCSNNKTNSSFFFVMIFIVTIIFAALPMTHVDIAVKSHGIIRPAHERAEIKSVMQGIIDSVFCREGKLVQQGSEILRLKDEITKTKSLINQREIDQCTQCIHDLQLLTTNKNISKTLINQLISPIYKTQSFRFIHHGAEQRALLKKANKDETINNYLYKEKVISSKEFFDIQIQQEKANASYKAFMQDQQSEWQQDLMKYKSTLSQCEAQQKQLEIDADHYKIKSPVTGIIQGIYRYYPGDWLPSNEAICFVSPEDDLVAECYVSSRNVGLIKNNQPAYFQVDAFNYNYFGLLSGYITAIDNDYTLIDNQPFFKVRCNFDNKQLHTKKGTTVQLKKGLSFQARFIIGQRTIWQLLFDKMDDWLNPAAP